MRCSIASGRFDQIVGRMPPLVVGCDHVLKVLRGPYNVWLTTHGPHAICIEEITLAEKG
jgi:hypothetical protein